MNLNEVANSNSRAILHSFIDSPYLGELKVFLYDDEKVL
jgi:hypothetical protein